MLTPTRTQTGSMVTDALAHPIAPFTVLEGGQAPPADSSAVDPVALLLSEKRSEATRQAYRADFTLFFGEHYQAADVRSFAARPPHEIAERLQAFKNDQIVSGMSEATIARRLASLRSLLRTCHRLGLSETNGVGLVHAEKIRTYRDTRGISLPLMRQLLGLPGTATLKGKRDTFLLRLAFENGLRCAEMARLQVSDLQVKERRLRICGKGRGTQTEYVDVSAKLIGCAKDYLKASGHTGGALFRSCSHNGRPSAAGNLTTDGVYYVVRSWGSRMGLQLSPHKLRHTAITQAAKDAKGDLVAVQDFSRHASIDTVRIYVDNVQAAQRKITNKLSRKV